MTHTPNDVSLRPEADGVPGNGGAPGGGFGGVGATLGSGGRLGGGRLGGGRLGGGRLGGGRLGGGRLGGGRLGGGRLGGGRLVGGGGGRLGGRFGGGGRLVVGGKLAGTGVPETSHTPPSHCASLKHDLPLASAFTTPRDTPVVAIVVIIIETNAVVVARGH